jgi:hypothetical protein
MRSWPSRGNIRALSDDTEQDHEESQSSHTTARCSKQAPGEYESRTSIPGRVVTFFYPVLSRPALGPTESLIQRVLEAHAPEVKLPGRGADHSSPSSVEFKNGGAILPLPHTSLWSGV